VLDLIPGVDPNGPALVRSQVDGQLHEIRPMGEDHGLGHDVMMSIRGDIARITGVAAEERWPPGAVALFSCSGRGFFEEVQLPRGVRDQVVVDETPWVRSMMAVLDEYHRCCVAVVDRETARTWSSTRTRCVRRARYSSRPTWAETTTKPRS